VLYLLAEATSLLDLVRHTDTYTLYVNKEEITTTILSEEVVGDHRTPSLLVELGCSREEWLADWRRGFVLQPSSY
jgi:hypothetical protein